MGFVHVALLLDTPISFVIPTKYKVEVAILGNVDMVLMSQLLHIFIIYSQTKYINQVW